MSPTIIDDRVKQLEQQERAAYPLGALGMVLGMRPGCAGARISRNAGPWRAVGATFLKGRCQVWLA